MLPVRRAVDVKYIKRDWINQVYVVRLLEAQHKRSDASKRLRRFAAQHDQVVPANRRNLQHERVLIIEHIRFLIVRYQLSTLLRLDRHHTVNKRHEGLCVRFGREVEINAFIMFLHVQRLRVRLVLEYQLLQVQERHFVVHLLPNLHCGVPQVRRERLLAVVALRPFHLVLQYKRRTGQLLVKQLLNGYLHLYQLRVRLRPHKRRVNYLRLVQALYLR